LATVDVSSGSRGDAELDHEKFAGGEIPDPWADDEQTDWPNHPEMEVSDEQLGADEGSH
jgi:hypothetical protein